MAQAETAVPMADSAANERFKMCRILGPRVEHDVPNGWGSSPVCTLVVGHVGPHRYVGRVGGGYTIEWNEPCERAAMDGGPAGRR